MGDSRRGADGVPVRTEGRLTLSSLVKHFRTVKERQQLSKRYLQDIKSRLGQFSGAFGNWPVSSINTEVLEEWVTDRKTGPVDKQKVRRLLVILLNFAVDRGYRQDNPATKCANPKSSKEEAEVLTPDQATRLLESARPEVVPYLAIGLFAGLRPSEIEGLDWSKINLAERTIVVKPEHKKAFRRVVDIQERGVEVGATGSHRNWTAGRGCQVAPCSASQSWLVSDEM